MPKKNEASQEAPPQIVIEEKTCNFCGHKWFPRMPGRPAVCPKCKNPRWDQERKFHRKK